MLCRRHAGVSCFFSMDYCRRCVSGVSSCHRWKLNQSLVARGTSKQVVVTKWPWFPAHARRTQECAKVAMDTRCCVRVLGSSFDVAMICLDMPSNEWGKSRKGHKNSDSPDVGQIINHGGILYSMHPTSLIAYYMTWRESPMMTGFAVASEAPLVFLSCLESVTKSRYPG